MRSVARRSSSLPVFLLVLAGMLRAVQIAVQSERVQSAIRYTWAISQRTNPSGSLSGLNVILACYPGMDTLVNASLTAPNTSSAAPPTNIVYATMDSQTENQLDGFNPNETPCGYTPPP
jgi:hypothetical protein